MMKFNIFNETINPRLIGRSQELRQVLSLVRKMQKCDTIVHINGDTGTGKELVAREIHFYGNRASKPFVPINCSAIPSDLVESELLGHEKGAFTGAYKTKIGKFEQANGGTLFLDEICSLALEAQAKLLRIIEDTELTRVGGDSKVKIDIRLITASNKCLKEMVRLGKFRSDLYYRLCVFPINIPSLTNRIDDIEILLKYFIENYAQVFQKGSIRISNDLVDYLKMYKWPGNIRELKNVIERIMVLKDNDILEVDDFAPELELPVDLNVVRNGKKDQIVKTLLLDTLRDTGYRKGETAKRLGIHRNTVRNMIKKFNIANM